VSSHRKAKSSRPTSIASSRNTPGRPSSIQATSALADAPGQHDNPQPDENDDPLPPEVDSDNEDDGYPPPNADDDDHTNPTQSLLPPPSFSPLFTLITDSQTAETHHPSVYYVFSDDAENERQGHDVATIAALTALRNNNLAAEDTQNASAEEDSETEERFVILDLEPSADDDNMGVRVKSISSLSPVWAVTSTTLRHAPTLEEDQQDGSLMLKIDGIEISDSSSRHATGAQAANRIKKQVERRAAEMLEDARKRGSGSVIDGMGELFRHLHQGLDVVDKIAGEADVQEAEE